jgi:hypothetical protein
MNNITLAGLMVTSPSAAFAELRERPRFWMPLVVLAVAMIAQQFWYYSIVDIDWLKDHLYTGNARIDAMPPEARARMMEMMSRKALTWGTVISLAIFIPLIFAIMAGYYKLAGKITNANQTYKQWFTLATWSALPMLVGTVSGAVILLMQQSNAQLGPSELQILSANELFFHRTPAQPGYQLLQLLSPITFWTWALGIIGVKTWSGRSWVFSSVFMLLPMAVIFGIGIARAL